LVGTTTQETRAAIDNQLPQEVTKMLCNISQLSLLIEEFAPTKIVFICTIHNTSITANGIELL
jgi:hypothetical protein